MDHRILVLFAHPALERSRVHRRLAEVPPEVDGVTLHDLYEAYPDLDVDVRREQALLLEHDVVVFQHPLYWYSAPPLLKQWLDLVLEHGWAYGQAGTQLHGKWAMHVVSCGGGAEAYRAGGHNRFTIGEFLRPFEQTAALCGMTWLPPFVAYGTHRMSPADIDGHAAGYRGLLEALAGGAIDPEAVRERPRINEGEGWLGAARPRDGGGGGASDGAGEAMPETAEASREGASGRQADGASERQAEDPPEREAEGVTQRRGEGGSRSGAEGGLESRAEGALESVVES